MADLVHLAGTFLWLSLIAVGGGLGVLPEMQRQVVGRYGWVTTREFVDGYTLSQLTPGPSMLVAIFVGYRAHGLVGALVAGVAMFLPTSLLTASIARRWARIRGRPWALVAERALAPVGVGLMGGGVYALARSAVHDWVTAALAAAAAAVLATRWLPPVVVVLAGGLVGWFAGL
jgi:chromate transporter